MVTLSGTFLKQADLKYLMLTGHCLVAHALNAVTYVVANEFKF